MFPRVEIKLREPANLDVIFALISKFLRPDMATFQDLVNFIVKIPGANIGITWEGITWESGANRTGAVSYVPAPPRINDFQISIPFNYLKNPPIE